MHFTASVRNPTIALLVAASISSSCTRRDAIETSSAHPDPHSGKLVEARNSPTPDDESPRRLTAAELSFESVSSIDDFLATHEDATSLIEALRALDSSETESEFQSALKNLKESSLFYDHSKLLQVLTAFSAEKFPRGLRTEFALAALQVEDDSDKNTVFTKWITHLPPDAQVALVDSLLNGRGDLTVPDDRLTANVLRRLFLSIASSTNPNVFEDPMTHFYRRDRLFGSSKGSLMWDKNGYSTPAIDESILPPGPLKNRTLAESSMYAASLVTGGEGVLDYSNKLRASEPVVYDIFMQELLSTGIGAYIPGRLALLAETAQHDSPKTTARYADKFMHDLRDSDPNFAEALIGGSESLVAFKAKLPINFYVMNFQYLLEVAHRPGFNVLLPYLRESQDSHK